jgi:hypothetical protein
MDSKTQRAVHDLPLDRSLEILMDLYVQKHGEYKAKGVVAKVTTSPKVNAYLTKQHDNGGDLNASELRRILKTIPYFFFSPDETICLASTLAFEIWYRLKIDDTNPFSHGRLIVQLNSILTENSNNQIFGNDIFFEKFFQHINNALSEYKSF